MPVLLVIVVSKWVASLFNEGIYESYIALRRIPLLPPEHPTGMKVICLNVLFLINLCSGYVRAT